MTDGILTALQFVPLFVLAIAIALAVLFRKLLHELYALRRSVGIHHVVLTAVGTMHGLVDALERGLESGGLPDETRKALYRAHAEQVQFVYDRIGVVSGRSDLFIGANDRLANHETTREQPARVVRLGRTQYPPQS